MTEEDHESLLAYLHFVVDGDRVGQGINRYPREHVYLVPGRWVASAGACRAHGPREGDLGGVDGEDAGGDVVVREGLVVGHAGRVASSYGENRGCRGARKRQGWRMG